MKFSVLEWGRSSAGAASDDIGYNAAPNLPCVPTYMRSCVAIEVSKNPEFCAFLFGCTFTKNFKYTNGVQWSSVQTLTIPRTRAKALSLELYGLSRFLLPAIAKQTNHSSSK